MDKPHPKHQNLTIDVAIVGAGFSGCYALHKVRELGFSAKILEAGTDFGGVWHFNRYPGARVDSDTPSYQLSLPNVWEGFNCTERYPGHDELRAYFAHVDKVLDLRRDTVFGAAVSEARYDKAAGRWALQTRSQLRVSCRFVIFASGTTNKPYIPAFPGLDGFGGQVIHPRSWPSDLEVKGKRVGVIGQGASGIQIVQELAKQDCQLTVFVRTPCIAIPMRQRSLRLEETEQAKNLYDGIFSKAKFGSTSALPYNQSSHSFRDATEEQHNARYERLWARGGLGLMLSNYKDIMVDEEANASLYDFWVQKVRSRMTDCDKMDIVAPRTQFQTVGTQRVNLETDYYEMLDMPAVKVVDLKRRPIVGFCRDGVLVGDQMPAEHIELDVVIMATGYDCVTGSLFDMNIYDKDGTRLQDRWSGGISTYLGTVASGLPNAFFLYGPQAPTTQTNAPPFIEMQVDWVATVLRRLRSEGLESFEVPQNLCDAWRGEVQSTFESTLMKKSTAWWTGRNIPGKTQEPLIYFGGVQRWRQACMRALANWSEVFVGSARAV